MSEPDETAAPSPVPPIPWKLTAPNGGTILVFVDQSDPPMDIDEVRACDANGQPAELARDLAGIIVSEEMLMDLRMVAGEDPVP